MADSAASDPTSFDSGTFRNVLGMFPTGVTVVTCPAPDSDPDEAGPAAIVIGSFVSVSLDPPLVGWFVDKGSSTWTAIEAAGKWCVNVLAEDQVDLSNQFASKRGPEKFAGVDCAESPVTGSPILPDVCAWIDCTNEAVHDCGDHWFVLGKVEALSAGREVGPLVFGGGGYKGTREL